MLIATRILTLRRKRKDVDVPVRIFMPRQHEQAWSCRIEIDWPRRKFGMDVYGVDAVQALELALKMIGANLYCSRYHESGALMWLEPGTGYGFPVVRTIRDLLVGQDKTL